MGGTGLGERGRQPGGDEIQGKDVSGGEGAVYKEAGGEKTKVSSGNTDAWKRTQVGTGWGSEGLDPIL